MPILIKASGPLNARAFAVLVVCAVMSSVLQANPSQSLASPQLISWVEQALAQSHELQAAAASVQAARVRLTGAGFPLYNPELELEYEHSEIDLATAELLQSFDWHDKRGVREQVAEGSLRAARFEYEALRERLAGDLISALAVYEGSRAAAELAVRQVVVLERFADIARSRGRAGDLGKIEVELAQMAYVAGEMAAAGKQAAIADAEGALYRITGVIDLGAVILPRVPPDSLPESRSPDMLTMRHPDVRVARARAQAAQAAVQQADLDRRVDPTIGIKGGREDEETLVGLRLSIPLQVRNDFRAEVDAARSESAHESQNAARIERQTLAQLHGARTRYQALLRAWRIWERKGRGSLEAQLKLFERLWRVGELSTTDYLVQVKQGLETESGGLTLRRELWQAWIAWLRAAGQVQTWLGLAYRGEAR